MKRRPSQDINPLSTFPDIAAGILGVVLLLWIMVQGSSDKVYIKTLPNTIEVSHNYSKNIKFGVVVKEGSKIHSSMNAMKSDIIWEGKDKSLTGIFEGMEITSQDIGVVLLDPMDDIDNDFVFDIDYQGKRQVVLNKANFWRSYK